MTLESKIVNTFEKNMVSSSFSSDVSTIKNIFGTDGIRGTVSIPPFRIEELIHLGYVLGLWASQRYGVHPSLLLAHDTRVSCSLIKSALQTGLLLHAVKLNDAQVLPTPVVHYLTYETKKYDCGIMISASHNPYQDNGIKIIDSRQGKLSVEDERALSMLYATTTTTGISYSSLGTLDNSLQEFTKYKEHLTQHFTENFLCDLTIVLDCAHGATYNFAPDIFTHFGAKVIILNNQPTGTNINDNCGSLHIDGLKKAVTLYHADVGFAFDGDGDRVIAVNRHGQEKNGDAILAMLLDHPSYKDVPMLVGTLMTNQGLEKLLERKNKKLVRAQVGDKYVAEQLKVYDLPLGGEQSGHIIIKDLVASGDGIAVALKLLEAIIKADNLDMNSFESYPQVLCNMPVIQRHDLMAPEIVFLRNKAEQQLLSGRIIIRYSGTENVLRIMVEDETYDNAYMVATNLTQDLERAFRLY